MFYRGIFPFDDLARVRILTGAGSFKFSARRVCNPLVAFLIQITKEITGGDDEMESLRSWSEWRERNSVKYVTNYESNSITAFREGENCKVGTCMFFQKICEKNVYTSHK